MLFNAATLLLPLLVMGRAILASPLEPRTAGTLEAVEVSSSPQVDYSVATDAVRRPNVKRPTPPPGSTQFTPNTGFYALAPEATQVFWAFVADGCGTQFDYWGYNIASMAANTCYAAGNFFRSFEVDSTTTLPYAFYVALTNCNTSVQIPTLNTCYHMTNPDGTVWNLLIDFWHS